MSRLAGRKDQPGRTRPRVNLSLGVEALQVLGRVVNGGRYVDQVLRDRDRRWRRALTDLATAGFTPAELFAARDVLRDLEATARRDEIAAAFRAGALTAMETWKVPARAWSAKLRLLEHDGHLARALLELVLESWAGNLDVAEAIDGIAGGD